MRYKVKEVVESDAEMAEIEKLIDSLADKWPSPVVARRSVSVFTGGLYSTKFLANEDCKGSGPKGGFTVGGSKAYSVESFIAWMKNRASVSWASRRKPA